MYNAVIRAAQTRSVDFFLDLRSSREVVELYNEDESQFEESSDFIEDGSERDLIDYVYDPDYFITASEFGGMNVLDKEGEKR